MTNENLQRRATADASRDKEPPLWSIGLAVAVILGAPLLLYSLAPTGPLHDGDTVFSDGQQKVQIVTVAPGLRFHEGDTCLLDPNSPLILLRLPREEQPGSFLAEVQGNPATEWPFCPVHTEVWLNPHQMFQKPAVIGMVREALAGFFRR